MEYLSLKTTENDNQIHLEISDEVKLDKFLDSMAKEIKSENKNSFWKKENFYQINNDESKQKELYCRRKIV